MCAFVYVCGCVCVCYRYRPLRRQWHSQQVNNLMCKVFFAAQQARSLAGITSHSQSFCRAIIKIHFLSTVSTATHIHSHILTHPHTDTQTCYRWRNLVWISMAATILPLPPRALFTYAHVCVRLLCVAVRLCICKCVCVRLLCVCFHKCLAAIWMRQFLLNWSQKWPLIFDTISVIFTWPGPKVSSDFY